MKVLKQSEICYDLDFRYVLSFNYDFTTFNTLWFFIAFKKKEKQVYHP